MRDAQPPAIYLKDYRPPAYLIDETALSFQLILLMTINGDCGGTPPARAMNRFTFMATNWSF